MSILFRLALVLSVLSPSFFVSPTAWGEDRAIILHWNDFHGQVLPRVRSNGNREGGVRALARMVQETRTAEGDERVLLLDAGDWFQGTPEGNFTRGRMIIDLWNALGVDVAVVGNHDYDHGEPNLVELCGRARFPVLGANVVDDRGEVREYLRPSVIVKAGGITFGVIGLLSPRTPSIVSQDIGRHLRVADAVDACRRQLPALREAGAECLVVLSHLGVGPERELADAVEGIDLVVGGHSHTPVFTPHVGQRGTVCVQAGCKGQYLGRIEVRRDPGGGFSIAAELLPVLEREGERSTDAIESIIESTSAQIEEVMGEVVGQQEEALLPPERRGANGSSSLGNWLCDVLARTGGTTIALHNRGGIRDAVDPGPVDIRTLFQVSPFGNEVVVCRLTGADLREVLARAIVDPEVRLEVAGLRVFWRMTGAGPELIRIEVGGEPLDPARVYAVTTNSYLAFGGDDWTQFQKHSAPVSCSTGVFEASVDEFRRVGTVPPPREQRFTQVQGGSRAVSFLGIFVLLGLAYLLSVDRRRVNWRPVIAGIVLQFGLAYLILDTAAGRMTFDVARDVFTKILEFSAEGTAFVFPGLGEFRELAEIPGVKNADGVLGVKKGFQFSVQVAGTIIFVSSVTAVLYHIGVMQRIVYVMALGMHWTMRVSGAESLAAAANVFVGQTEAPLTVRPYLGFMTASELNSLMCGGMATVAGGVLAAYVSFGIDAGHLLAASVMSAPAALAVAKIIAPETEESKTSGQVPFEVERPDSNLLDAACRGAGEGLKLCLNVMAMLIAFIALMALVNFLIRWGHYCAVYSTLSEEMIQNPSLFDSRALSLQEILGWVFAPLAWIMGVQWTDATEIGRLLGTKMVLNEFIAFLDLAQMSDLAPRSRIIATYALCGFANFSSIAIQIGGIGTLEPKVRPKLARLGLRAMLGGTLAAMMTGTIAGVLVSD